VTDRVVMHLFSYPGYVTASELEYRLRNGGTRRAQALTLSSDRLTIEGVTLRTSSPTGKRLARGAYTFRFGRIAVT
jgi:hypothetical protein